MRDAQNSEIPHQIFIVVEGTFTAETLAGLASIVNDYNENKHQQQQTEPICCGNIG